MEADSKKLDGCCFTAPDKSIKDKVESYCKSYSDYQEAFYDYIVSDEGAVLVQMFEEEYPGSGIRM